MAPSPSHHSCIFAELSHLCKTVRDELFFSF